MNIKEIRNTTGLSQRSFSKMFNIPIGVFISMTCQELLDEE